ncbi:integrase [Alphaproteobacteria bacterium LSUCC0684]
MANIRKRGNKWQVQIRRAGYSSITKTFHRREEAIAWGRSQEVRLNASEAGIALPVKETLTELLGRYAAEVTPQKKSAASESRRIARLLKDPISQYRIRDLTPETLSKFRDRRLLDGQRAAAYDLQIIRHALNIASSEWGVSIKENPLDKVRFPAPSKPRDRRLKAGELDVLLAAANESGSAYMPALILLAVETGMRAGEMLKLKWADWNEEEAILHLIDTKNGRDRFVPLTPRANQVILSISRTSDRILPTNYEAVKSAWQRLRKRTGILDLRLHDLRHEATSRFFEMGLTVPEVASITGHQTPTMLLRYAHADVQMLRRKLTRVTSDDN